jgi:glutamate 5-kinase
LVIDSGAVDALLKQGKSLLPAGIIKIEGSFDKGQTLRVFDEANHELARGLVRYNSEELGSIAGRHSKEISAILGYTEGAEVMHRNDMVLLDKSADKSADKSVSTKEPES